MADEVGFDEILRVLSRHEVEFMVVGGIAAILHGSPLTTEDLDVLFRLSGENTVRLHRALSELDAEYLDPAGRRIAPTVQRLATQRMHLLRTKLGRVDVMPSIGKDLRYEDLLGRSRQLEVAGSRVRVLELEAIIESKEQADRPKDRFQLPYLKQLAVELERPTDE